MVSVPINFNSAAFMMMVQARAMVALINCLNIVKEECLKAVPVDIGELRDSIRTEPPKWITPFIIEGKVIAGSFDVPQAYYTEYGTPAHGPVFAQAMHFHWKGAEIYTKWVRGVIPMHWMRNSVLFSLPLIEMEIGLFAAQFLGTYILMTDIK